LQRAYDQLLHDVCLQNAHVVFAADRAGVAGYDGETHQGIYDLAFLRHMPNMEILAPSCAEELEAMLSYALYEARGPVAIRYPHEGASQAALSRKLAALRLDGEIRRGRGAAVLEGSDVTIVAVGAALEIAADAASAPNLGTAELPSFSVELISARFVKPLDEELIVRSVSKTGRLVVVEDGCARGGFGSAVLELLAERGVPCVSKIIGFPDEPIPHGSRSELLELYGLSASGVAEAARQLM
jgi:1-deoxy-D-xylulose-5-phosphate synthase